LFNFLNQSLNIILPLVLLSQTFKKPKTIFMRKLMTIALFAFLLAAKGYATARLQIIHNSADAAAATVDVYVNSSLFLEDVAFRTATAFNDVPSGVPLVIDITPPNTSLAQSVYNTSVTLTSGETYVVIANGIVNPSGYTPATPFNLYVYAMGRETSGNSSETDVMVFHGATDAPAVDVVERGVGAGLIIDDMAYGDFTGYLDLPTADFTLDVRTSNTLTTVASYDAPLATLNAGGAALVVVASGFLNPANNNNGAAFGLFAALPSGGALLPLPAATTSTTGSSRVQVIHNSADAAAATVDVYINGGLAADDFTFRTATPFIDLPSEIDIEVGIAPANSTSAGDAIVTFNYTFADGETYVIIANGIVSPSGYSPATPFNLYVYAMGRETSGSTSETDVMVFHGATDAPAVDVVERGVGAGLIIDDMAYGNFTGYLDLPTADFTLDVRTSNTLTTVASYDAPLATLNAGGAALVVLASGFLNPANNSNGAAFGLYAALPSGGALLELPAASTSTTGSSRVQVIHNSADAAAATVDVYINGDLAADDFAFRTATPFIDLPSEIDIEVGIAPANSTSAGDAIATFNYTLADGETYVIVANGIVSQSGYTPATPFNLYVYSMGRETSGSASETDVLVFHGATDAPTVDVVEVLAGAGTIVDNISYGSFAGYLDLTTADYEIEVRDETGATTVACYSAPLASLSAGSAALVVVASGFLDPSNNSNGAAFGLYAALPSGGALLGLPACVTTSVEDLNTSSLNIYPNPVSGNQVVFSSDELIQGIDLFDLNGALIASEKNIDINSFSFNTLNISSGIYFAKVKTAGTTTHKRIVVE
jgi:hypothetical protein